MTEAPIPNTTSHTAEETQADNSMYKDPSPGPPCYLVTTITTGPDIYFNQLDWNSACFCHVFLTPPPMFRDTLVLFLMTGWTVGGQRLYYQLYFHPLGEFLHSSLNKYNIQIAALSILNAVDGMVLSSPGNRETCPWLANNHNLASSCNTFDPLSSFIIARLWLQYF